MARSPATRPGFRQAMRLTLSSGGATLLLRRFQWRDTAALAGELLVFLLPARWSVRWRNLHRGDLVFRTIGRPVGVVGGDDIGLGVRMVERCIDDARRHTVGEQSAQRRLAGAARQPHPVAVTDAALLGIVRVDLEQVFLVPERVVGAAR